MGFTRGDKSLRKALNVGQNREVWLDEYGQLRFRHKYIPKLNAIRSYYWNDRMLYQWGREVIHIGRYSEFDNALGHWLAVER